MTAAEQLNAYVQRLERLLDEIDGLKDDLKDLKTEIKSQGFNVRALERVVAIRRKDSADKEAEFLNDILLYAHATGTHIDLVAPEPESKPEEVVL
ncbi:GapR family DNA-binding domain-containing protein [Arenibaculum pallidiluteum]|uniref:GapR family DNA-binding domain-containing protein n=1 Tax=Arenibaculum pallidiluteum TaxID=2812559 RepID=UPI001A96FA3F|nr:GapR family DNA-binding domain-containing protein [Arenibaculum pallidiluteum]